MSSTRNRMEIDIGRTGPILAEMRSQQCTGRTCHTFSLSTVDWGQLVVGGQQVCGCLPHSAGDGGAVRDTGQWGTREQHCQLGAGIREELGGLLAAGKEGGGRQLLQSRGGPSICRHSGRYGEKPIT